MYTNTPAAKFLVLSPTQAGPHESAPRVRSNSSSSTDSKAGQLKDTLSPLPAGFLFLGYDAPAQAASSE